MDVATVGALVTLGGVAGGLALKGADALIKVIRARAEVRKEVVAGETSRRDITVTELWELIKQQKADRTADRDNYATEKAELHDRLARVDDDIRQCREDHRKSELERELAFARIKTLEDRHRIGPPPEDDQ